MKKRQNREFSDILLYRGLRQKEVLIELIQKHEYTEMQLNMRQAKPSIFSKYVDDQLRKLVTQMAY